MGHRADSAFAATDDNCLCASRELRTRCRVRTYDLRNVMRSLQISSPISARGGHAEAPCNGTVCTIERWLKTLQTLTRPKSQWIENVPDEYPIKIVFDGA
jgi:hypothetical protein